MGFGVRIDLPLMGSMVCRSVVIRVLVSIDGQRGSRPNIPGPMNDVGTNAWVEIRRGQNGAMSRRIATTSRSDVV